MRQGSPAWRVRWMRALSKFLPLWLPLSLRQSLLIVAKRLRLPGNYWLAMELLKDFAHDDPDGYHAFLWRHHLAYASTYEVDLRFGGRLNETRRRLFGDLQQCLLDLGAEPAQTDSVFEVGCSLGYLLRFMETDVFPRASVLEGIDVDERAVRKGRAHLRAIGSKVRISQGDLRELPRTLTGRSFDVIVCAGVLMYVREPVAAATIRTMLDHANTLVAISSLAHPSIDNADLEHSTVRSMDGTFVHNIDEMVRGAGGTTLARRWEGGRDVDGNTVYFVFAVGGLGKRGGQVLAR